MNKIVTGSKTPLQWTHAHFEQLNAMFPEELDCSDPNRLLLASGKRTVVNAVQQLVELSKHRST